MKLRFFIALAISLVCTTGLKAETIDLLGDKDGFGIGLEEGDARSTSSPMSFDAREWDDPYFTDVWPIPGTSTPNYSFTYTHNFSPPSGPVIAEIRLFTTGIQDGDSQVVGMDTDIKLFLDDMEVPEAFDSVDQFGWVTGLGWAETAGKLTVGVPESFSNIFLDGEVVVRYEVLNLGTHPSVDAFAIDFSELILEPAFVEVFLDIKFCSDPNAFNCKKKGVLAVTIFGAEDILIEDIDPSSLQLCTEDMSECTGAPREYSYADRGDPTTDLGAAMCVINPDTGEEELSQDGFLDLDAAFEASDVKDLLGVFCDLEKGAISESLVLTGETYEGITISSVPMDDVGIDQLLKVNKSSVAVDCPCWTPDDLSTLPIPETVAYCETTDNTLRIWQDGIWEYDYYVSMNSLGAMYCTVNRGGVPGLEDLFVNAEVDANEFAVCLNQIASRCEELGIDLPEWP